jgi:hypothetical protein
MCFAASRDVSISIACGISGVQQSHRLEVGIRACLLTKSRNTHKPVAYV